MPGVTQEQIAAARRMSAIEFLQKYRPNSLVKSSARGEYQLAEHDSFKINAKSSLWHWKSRDIGGKSALNYLIYVEGVPFVEAVRLLCEESPGYVPTPHEQVERKRPSFRLPPIAENCDRITRYLLGRGISKAMPTYYWSRLCALNITPQFCVELVAWVIVALAVAAGLGWMALHRPDAGKQRSARKAHAVLRRREKSVARQGMHRASTFSAALYALRCTHLPGMLALFGLLCMAFALGVSESRIVDATWADGRRVGIFPGGSLPVGSAADAALGTVLSVGILAWIAVILVAVMAFHQNKTAGAARLAVTYGVSRVRYMVGSFAAETIMLQGWYMVLYFLLSVVTGSLSQPGRTAFFWMQSAWILQASYAAVWLVCRLCGSELAGATFCFVVTLAGVIVSVSAPDPAAVSPLSALLFYATPMPYWLALGGGHPIPWQAVGYGAGVTALCLAAALAITTVRDVE